MMNLNFAAGIVLYYPSKDQLNNVIGFEKLFSHVFVFDNSGTHSMFMNDFEWPENYIYMNENSNMGLPYAYNKIIEKCEDDYICMLDQDSCFKDYDLQIIINYIKNIGREYNIGIISPFINYGKNKCLQKKSNVEEKKWVIASGSFINVNCVKKERISFDEKYFIDRFDVDFCYQLRARGYKILMHNESTLYQQLGEKTVTGRLNHNPLRHYYVFRNRLYFNKKWHPYIINIYLNLLQSLKHILIILLFEEKKIDKIVFCALGLIDYYTNRMGMKQ